MKSLRPGRVLFWVQSLLGSGHLQRIIVLARACSEMGIDVLVASGGRPILQRIDGSIRFEQLFPIIADDACFTMLVDRHGSAIREDDWTRRLSRLRAIWDEFEPDVLVTEMFPFGRRAFGRELLPLLETARASRPSISVVSSVRDVLVSKKDPSKYAVMQLICDELYDHVLVHSDEHLIPFSSTFPFAYSLGTKLLHTGFVVHELACQENRVRRGVVVSAGGGAVGEKLLSIAREAFALSAPTTHPWRILTGQNLSERAFLQLSEDAPRGLIVERYRDDFPTILAEASLSISQAGYNTVVECLAAGTPMILVPFASATEDEQTTRACILAARGFATVLNEGSLTPSNLARAVIEGIAREPLQAQPPQLDGAAVTATFLASLAAWRQHD